MYTLRLPATLDSFEKLRDFVLQRVDELGASAKMAFQIELVLEELLTNVIHYAYPDDEGDVEVECWTDESGAFHLRILDWGQPFDPLAHADPDLSPNVSSRRVGGLGILLIKEMADQVCYARNADQNILTIAFKADSHGG